MLVLKQYLVSFKNQEKFVLVKAEFAYNVFFVMLAQIAIEYQIKAISPIIYSVSKETMNKHTMRKVFCRSKRCTL